MRKILSKIAGLALGLSLAIGVGVALVSKNVPNISEAASGDVYTFGNTSGTSSDTAWSFTTAKNSGSTAPAWNSNNSELRLYPKNSITITAKSGYTLQSAVFTNKFNFKNGSTIESWLPDNGTITAFSNQLTTFTVSSIDSSALTITFDGSKGNIGLKTVAVTYSSGSAASLETITLSGSLNKTSYTTAESWSSAGLVVTGNYDDESHEDLTSNAQFSYFDSNDVAVASPAALGSGTGLTLKVMATFDTFSSNKLQFTVDIELVAFENSTSLVPGEYFIKYNSNYFTGVVSSGKGSSSSSQPGATGQFTFSLIGNDTWSVVNGNDQYLGIGSSSTSLSLDNSATSLTIEDGVEGGDGHSFKIKGSSGRYMAWYASGSDFRTYTSGEIVMTLESTSVESYTITYNANAGDAEGSMSPSTGCAPQVAACAFTRDGYSFLRWNTQPDGEGEDYAVGATVAADIALYVIWQEYIAPIGGNVTMSGEENASSATVNTHSAIKCGTGSKAGKMSLTLGLANMTKIKVYVAGWKGEDKTVGVTISSGTISPTTLNLYADSGIQGGGTDFTLSNSESTYKFEFTISEGVPANTVITLTAGVASNNRFVVWGATDLFAESFASEFNSNLACDATGEDGPSFTSGHDWTTMNSFYNGLDAEEKGRLHDATFTVSGSGSSTVVTATGDTVQSVAEAMARYDYIIAKYGTSEYTNFIGRSVTKLAPARIVDGTISSSSSTIIIVIVALTSITSIGVLLVIKRRRSLVK